MPWLLPTAPAHTRTHCTPAAHLRQLQVIQQRLCHPYGGRARYEASASQRRLEWRVRQIHPKAAPAVNRQGKGRLCGCRSCARACGSPLTSGCALCRRGAAEGLARTCASGVAAAGDALHAPASRVCNNVWINGH